MEKKITLKFGKKKCWMHMKTCKERYVSFVKSSHVCQKLVTIIINHKIEQLSFFSSMIVRPKVMEGTLNLGHKIGYWKMLEIQQKGVWKRVLNLICKKKKPKGKNRLLRAFSRENLFGK